MSDLEGKVLVQIGESKKFSGSNPLDIVFGPRTSLFEELNVEYYLLSSADLRQEIAVLFGSDALYENIVTLATEMREHERFRCAVARADRAYENIGSLAYSLLCSAVFVDYSNESRFEEKPLPDVIRSTLEKFQKEIPGLFSESLEALLQKRLQQGSFEPADLISNNEIDAGHQKMVLAAFGIDELLKLLKKRLTRISQCAVERRALSVGEIPTRQLSLQPVAIGAVVEVKKRPKPSV